MRRWTVLFLVMVGVAMLVRPVGAVATTQQKWYWSASYADRTLLKKMRVPCVQIRFRLRDCSVRRAKKEVAVYSAALAGCKRLTDPAKRFECLQSLVNNPPYDPEKNLAVVERGFPLRSAACVGSGPRSGDRFAAFRCDFRVIDAGWSETTPLPVFGRLLITPISTSGFRWLILSIDGRD
jgi:hypothetical protein